jgi:hypothetical protein
MHSSVHATCYSTSRTCVVVVLVLALVSQFLFIYPCLCECAGPQPLTILLRMLCEPFNWMSVEFLPIYQPSAEEKADVNLYARHVRDVMAAALGVVTVRAKRMSLSSTTQPCKMPACVCLG